MRYTGSDRQDLHLFFNDKMHSRLRRVEVGDIYDVSPKTWKFMSLFTVTREEMDTWDKNQKARLSSGDPSLSGFKGTKTYDAPFFPIDIDASNLQVATAHVSKIRRKFNSLNINYRIFFSGKKGYHIEVSKHDIGFKPRKDLAEVMASFAWRLKKYLGIDTIDESLYTRTHKYRVPNCPRYKHDDHGQLVRVNGERVLVSRKIMLPNKIDFTKFKRFKDFAKNNIAPKPEPFEDQGKNHFLSSLWTESVSYVECLPPITIKSHANISYKDGDVRDLINYFRSLPKSTHDSHNNKTQIVCPNPEHDDSDPSAVINQSGSVWCSACKNPGESPWGAREVGSWVGINVGVKKKKQKKKRFETLQEGRERISEIINNRVDNNKSFALKCQVGVGKSYMVREALMNYDKAALYVSNQHRMLDEAVQHLWGQHLDKYYEIEPRYVSEPFPLSDSLMSKKVRENRNLGDEITFFDEVEYRQGELGLPKMEVLRKADFHYYGKDRPSNPKCNYQKRLDAIKEGHDTLVSGDTGPTKKRVLDTTYAASAHLGLETMTDMLRGRDYLVIDEDPWDFILPTISFEKKDLAVLTSDHFCQGRFVYKKSEQERKVLKSESESKGESYEPEKIPLRDFMRTLLKGKIPSLGSEERTLSKDEWESLEFDDVIREGFWEMEVLEVGPKGQEYIGLDLSNMPEINEEATKFLNLLSSGRLESMGRYVDTSGYDYPDSDDGLPLCDRDGVTEYVLISLKRDLSGVKDVPVAILDASLDKFTKDVYELVLDRDLEVISSNVKNEESEIIHYPGRSWGRSRSQTALNKEDRSFKEITAYIKSLNGSVGLISQKTNAIALYLVDEGYVDRDYFAWYGGLRGLNRLEDVDHLVLLGDPAVHNMAYDIEVLRWGFDEWNFNEMNAGDVFMTFGPGYDAEDYTVNYRLKRPKMKTDIKGDANFKLGVSARSKIIYKRVILDELYQALGRARGLQHNVTIHAFCAPDVKCDDYKYTVKEGVSKNLISVKPKPHYWKLLHKTYLPATKISDLTGRSLKSVRNDLNDEAKVARLCHAINLKNDGHSYSEIGRIMESSKSSIYRKLKNYS